MSSLVLIISKSVPRRGFEILIYFSDLSICKILLYCLKEVSLTRDPQSAQGAVNSKIRCFNPHLSQVNLLNSKAQSWADSCSANKGIYYKSEIFSNPWYVSCTFSSSFYDKNFAKDLTIYVESGFWLHDSLFESDVGLIFPFPIFDEKMLSVHFPEMILIRSLSRSNLWEEEFVSKLILCFCAYSYFA